jgi:hypothetical protein
LANVEAPRAEEVGHGVADPGETRSSRRGGWLVGLFILGVVVSTVWSLIGLELTYEAQGSFLMSPVELDDIAGRSENASSLDAPTTTEELALKLSGGGARPDGNPTSPDFEVEIRSALAGLLEVRARASSPREADALVDDVIDLARETVALDHAVAVYFRTIPDERHAGEDPRATSVALLGVPGANDPLTRALRPRPQYLIRISEVLVRDRWLISHGPGPVHEVSIGQTDYDTAPVVDVRVRASTPAGALRAQEELGKELEAVVQQVQDRLSLPSRSRYQLVPLSVPTDARLVGDDLLGPLYRLTAAVLLVFALGAAALERAVRRVNLRQPPRAVAPEMPAGGREAGSDLTGVGSR